MSREYEKPYIDPPEAIHAGLDGTLYYSWEEVERAGQADNIYAENAIRFIGWLDAVQECIYAHFDGGYIDLETFDRNWLNEKLYPRYEKGMTPKNMANLFVRYIQFVKSQEDKR